MDIIYPGQVASLIDIDPVYIQLLCYDNILFKFSKAKIKRLFPSSLFARAIELDPEVKCIPIENPVVLPEALSILYQIMEEPDLIKGSAKDKDGIRKASKYLLIDLFLLFTNEKLDLIIQHERGPYFLSLANSSYVETHYEELLKKSITYIYPELVQYVFSITPITQKTYQLDEKYFLRGIYEYVLILEYLKRINPQTAKDDRADYILGAGRETCQALYYVLIQGIFHDMEFGQNCMKYLLSDSRVRDDYGVALSILLKASPTTPINEIKVMIDHFKYDSKVLSKTIIDNIGFYDKKPQDLIGIIQLVNLETCQKIVSLIIESPDTIILGTQTPKMTLLPYILNNVKLNADYVEYMIERISSYSGVSHEVINKLLELCQNNLQLS